MSWGGGDAVCDPVLQFHLQLLQINLTSCYPFQSSYLPLGCGGLVSGWGLGSLGGGEGGHIGSKLVASLWDRRLLWGELDGAAVSAPIKTIQRLHLHSFNFEIMLWFLLPPTSELNPALWFHVRCSSQDCSGKHSGYTSLSTEFTKSIDCTQ